MRPSVTDGSHHAAQCVRMCTGGLYRLPVDGPSSSLQAVSVARVLHSCPGPLSAVGSAFVRTSQMSTVRLSSPTSRAVGSGRWRPCPQFLLTEAPGRQVPPRRTSLHVFASSSLTSSSSRCCAADFSLALVSSVQERMDRGVLQAETWVCPMGTSLSLWR